MQRSESDRRDKRIYSETCQGKISNGGYFVRIFRISRLENNYFDIIITDYSMPGMNGVELTKTVRSLHPHVLIIGMSANRNEKDFLKAGAHSFLLKPLQLQELLSACLA